VLSWNRDIDAHNEDSLRRPIADTVRVFLRNLSTRPVIVHQVLFRGLDAHEFDVIDNQPGYRPLEGFILQPQDSIWVDVAWEADMSIPYPDKFRDRTATLVATYDNFAVLDSTAMQLVRRFAADSTASVWPSEATSSESLRATLAAGSLTIWWSRESAADHFELYDLLGRRIWMAHAPTLGENSLGPIVMAGPLLHSGIYVLRAVGTDGQLAECKLLVRN
jgi:hypothetical protein